jgi:DNA mismatch repair ATPase MutS
MIVTDGMLLKRAINYLLDGYSLMSKTSSNGEEYEFRYYRRGEEVHVGDDAFEVTENGIFKYCVVTTSSDNHKTSKPWIMRYCNLDDVDLLFKFMTPQEKEVLFVNIGFANAMRKIKNERT